MGNFYFYLFFLIIFLFTPTHGLEEIDYYAYFIPVQNIIICSEKEYIKNQLILNELENEFGYTCLMGLKTKGVYRISLHVSLLQDTTGMYADNNLSKPESKVMEISMGKNSLLKNIELSQFKNKTSFVKQFLVKFENGKIMYIPNNNCDIDHIESCSFMDTKDSLFMKKFMKLNFEFKEPNVQEITLLEKSSTSSKLYILFLAKFETSEDCDPACVHGVCNDGDCFCKLGYMGNDCSKSIYYF